MCALFSTRFIESMCQTIMAVDELLWVINNSEIDCNLKKPFLRYFLWVYMKTAGSAVESGAGDLPHDMWVVFKSTLIKFELYLNTVQVVINIACDLFTLTD